MDVLLHAKVHPDKWLLLKRKQVMKKFAFIICFMFLIMMLTACGNLKQSEDNYEASSDSEIVEQEPDSTSSVDPLEQEIFNAAMAEIFGHVGNPVINQVDSFNYTEVGDGDDYFCIGLITWQNPMGGYVQKDYVVLVGEFGKEHSHYSGKKRQYAWSEVWSRNDADTFGLGTLFISYNGNLGSGDSATDNNGGNYDSNTPSAYGGIAGSSAKVVSANGVNIYTWGSTSADIVITVRTGEIVNIIGDAVFSDGREWYPVEFEGDTGYAATEFLEVITDGQFEYDGEEWMPPGASYFDGTRWVPLD